MALNGDSVRLKVHFKTFEGVLVDPDSVTLTIYDNAQETLETITEGDLHQEDIGEYYYDYTIPDDISEYFIFEYGGLHNNKPILSRGKVNVTFK